MIIIYYHIGETGGSFINNIFINQNKIKNNRITSKYEFESYINNLKSINGLEYVELHAGNTISFYNSWKYLNILKNKFHDQIFIFTSLRDPFETIVSLYNWCIIHKSIIEHVSILRFINTFNYNYITNYLYANNTNFGIFNTLSSNNFDIEHIKTIDNLTIDSIKFNKLCFYMDIYFDFICYMDKIEDVIIFLNKKYGLKLIYNNITVNKINYIIHIPHILKKNKFVQKKLHYDYKLFNRYNPNNVFKMYLGSCRINGGSGTLRTNYFDINNSSEIGELLSYSHNTKEHIQLLQFINNEISIPEKYYKSCFRSYYIYDNYTLNIPKLKNRFLKSEVFILEISTRSVYSYNNIVCCWDFVDKNTNINSYQLSDKQIEEDLIFIRNYLKKPIIVISHINVKKDGVLLKKRANLISSLRDICSKIDITFIDPSVVLQEFPQFLIVCDDLQHYTEFGVDIITRIINYAINELIYNNLLNYQP